MTSPAARLGLCVLLAAALAGCSQVNTWYRRSVDRKAYRIIQQKQMEALGQNEPFTIETPEEALRRRLLLDQGLPYSTSASLGARSLEPIRHWPEKKDTVSARPDNTPLAENQALTITLDQALRIAAQNSRDYQTAKEDVFRAALDLDLESDAFRNTYQAAVDAIYTQDRTRLGELNGTVTEGWTGGPLVGFSRQFLNGAAISTQIGWDLVQLLQPNRAASSSVFGDASISIPLLRGAGRHIVAEPLTQAERNVLYAIWDFERFKQEFAVDITDSYLGVLQSTDQVVNQEQNYRGLITSTRRAMRLAEAGKLPQLQVDQAITNELRSRDRWVTAQENVKRTKDQFMILLGLPTDARIELDRNEFKKLHEYFESNMKSLLVDLPAPDSLPADAPIFLKPPDPREAGRYEFEYETAIPLAFDNRLDLRVRHGRVFDSQRQVVVRANRLLPEFSLLGTASAGQTRSLSSAAQESSTHIDLDHGSYRGVINLDLPLERTAEAINYRDSYITLEQRVRDLQNLEDQIKLQIRNSLRTLLTARESLKIQFQSVRVAERRVNGAALQLEAGRAQMRDLLDSQDALVSAQNSLTAAMVNYRVAELEIQRDLGVLQVDYEGLWHEFDPQEVKRENNEK